MNALSLQSGERLVFALRSLFDRNGYARYKMNKFEEYDLYARNKDFLVSDSVITFTDTNGRLMALKPDVTLSIVKNTRDEATVQKLYYNESVYRVSKGSRTFREITQVGLEAIGSVDDYTITEVLRLAAESLRCTERNCVLELSHLGLLSEVLAYAGIPRDEEAQVFRCIGEKNPHELTALCRRLGLEDEKTELLRALIALSGRPEKVLPELQTLLGGIVSPAVLSCFTDTVSVLQAGPGAEMLRIDFSVVSDVRYYNGFVFKGFAEGVPSSILSGGQYDTLMDKMKRKSRAIGFAVYLDVLEQFSTDGGRGVDDLILYDDTVTPLQIQAQAAKSQAAGRSVLVQRQKPENIVCERIITMRNGEVVTDA